jgi:hypothetical protein
LKASPCKTIPGKIPPIPVIAINARPAIGTAHEIGKSPFHIPLATDAPATPNLQRLAIPIKRKVEYMRDPGGSCFV